MNPLPTHGAYQAACRAVLNLPRRAFRNYALLLASAYTLALTAIGCAHHPSSTADIKFAIIEEGENGRELNAAFVLDKYLLVARCSLKPARFDSLAKRPLGSEMKKSISPFIDCIRGQPTWKRRSLHDPAFYVWFPAASRDDTGWSTYALDRFWISTYSDSDMARDATQGNLAIIVDHLLTYGDYSGLLPVTDADVRAVQALERGLRMEERAAVGVGP